MRWRLQESVLLWASGADKPAAIVEFGFGPRGKIRVFQKDAAMYTESRLRQGVDVFLARAKVTIERALELGFST